MSGGGGSAGKKERKGASGKVEKDGRRPTGPFKVPRRQQRASNELIKLSNSFGLASERANKCSPLPRGPLQRSLEHHRPCYETLRPNLCTLLRHGKAHASRRLLSKVDEELSHLNDIFGVRLTIRRESVRQKCDDRAKTIRTV